MNENIVRGNAAEIVEAETTIKVLTGELLKYKQFADKWMINFAVNLVQSAEGKYNIEVSGITGGGRGWRYTIDANEIANFVSDPVTLGNLISDTMMSQILQDVVREELTPQIVKAVNNAAKISKSAL